MSTRRAPIDWQRGHRLADDPTFDVDTERQLTLFETIPGVTLVSLGKTASDTKPDKTADSKNGQAYPCRLPATVTTHCGDITLTTPSGVAPSLTDDKPGRRASAPVDSGRRFPHSPGTVPAASDAENLSVVGYS
ncbi:MAG: hypothetical protein GXX96_27860 [Planctomycetaceae bacterium]|nr:hypothetical protein [Planctomycetaceae bacterium]